MSLSLMQTMYRPKCIMENYKKEYDIIMSGMWVNSWSTRTELLRQEKLTFANKIVPDQTGLVKDYLFAFFIQYKFIYSLKV